MAVWFSFTWEGTHWSGEPLLVALLCWPLRYPGDCDTTWNVDKLWKRSSSSKSTIDNTRCCQFCKAGDGHVKDGCWRQVTLQTWCVSAAVLVIPWISVRAELLQPSLSKSRLGTLSVSRLWISMSERSLASCISNKFPSDVCTFGSWITLGEAGQESAI